MGDFGCQNAKILENIARCARQEDTKSVEYQGLASDNEKSEDPAKMTYSIPDFVSRDATHKSTNGPTNALKLGHKPQKQMPWGKATNSRFLNRPMRAINK